ncbi:hypothetical protein HN682_02065 [Candidatus Peregrinibacteria bacterium]|nr:hypothetical protein [Candidatus Peregrinibacteria bacterium]
MYHQIEQANLMKQVIARNLIEMIPLAGFRHLTMHVDPEEQEIVIDWRSKKKLSKFYVSTNLKYRYPNPPRIGSLRHQMGINPGQLSVFKFEEFPILKAALEKLISTKHPYL